VGGFHAKIRIHVLAFWSLFMKAVDKSPKKIHLKLDCKKQSNKGSTRELPSKNSELEWISGASSVFTNQFKP
jgi:hypothetical protein